jgi:aminoglycoside phosphotransferase (APT) family kinase protein
VSESILSPSRDRYALDDAALSAYLEAHVDGFSGPLVSHRFAGGQSNPTYRLVTPERQYVMRSKPGPVAQLLPSAHAIEREFRVMAALANTSVPVPEMLHLCIDESVIGRAFYIMSHVQGGTHWDPVMPKASPQERSAIYDAMNATLAALHCVDPVGIGLGDYGKPGNYFVRQMDRWSRQYRASITQPIEEMDFLMDWLPSHVPDSAIREIRACISHGDFRLDNLLFDPMQSKVVAVIDWELSTLGHPLADLSYHCMAWHIDPAAFRGMAGVDLSSLGIPSEEQYIQKYLERAPGFEWGELRHDWNFYLAYNLFRMAAILQGIAKRVEQGIASDDKARQLAAGARPLAKLAWAKACLHDANK